MNSGSWSLDPISQDTVLVTVALVLVAILAVLTVIGMIVGARSRARRRAAEVEEQARMEQLRAEGVTASNGEDGTPAKEAPPAHPAAKTRSDRASSSPAPALAPAPVPVSPAPPPASDAVAPGTPPAAPDLADEPIAAAAPLDASPASVAADAPPTSGADADAPLTDLKGLGPKIAARLGELGIGSVGALAALDDRAAADLDAQLGPFQGRMTRDRWREQAQLLARGDRSAFEREFGKLG